MTLDDIRTTSDLNFLTKRQLLEYIQNRTKYMGTIKLHVLSNTVIIRADSHINYSINTSDIEIYNFFNRILNDG